MVAPVSLLLVDDHAIVRAGYRHLLEQQDRFVVVAEAQTAEEAYALFRRHRPDVVVTDLAMPGASGLEAILRILRADATARVLVFSMHVSPDFALAAMRAGALGYITKSSHPTFYCEPSPMYWLDAEFSAQTSRRHWHWRDSLGGVGRWKSSRRASLPSYACWSRPPAFTKSLMLSLPSRLSRITRFAPSFHATIQRYRALKSHLAQGCRCER